MAGHGITALVDKKLTNIFVPTDANISCANRAAVMHAMTGKERLAKVWS
jgi:hypothetical protein